MAFRTEAITVLPALFLFSLSVYLVILNFQVTNSSTQKTLLTIASSLFLGGLVLTACWFYFWGIRKRLSKERVV